MLRWYELTLSFFGGKGMAFQGDGVFVRFFRLSGSDLT